MIHSGKRFKNNLYLILLSLLSAGSAISIVALFDFGLTSKESFIIRVLIATLLLFSIIGYTSISFFISTLKWLTLSLAVNNFIAYHTILLFPGIYPNTLPDWSYTTTILLFAASVLYFQRTTKTKDQKLLDSGGRFLLFNAIFIGTVLSLNLYLLPHFSDTNLLPLTHISDLMQKTFGMMITAGTILLLPTFLRHDGNSSLYKTRRLLFIIPILLMLLGFYIRLIGLDTLEPYTDEYSHLVSAKAILQHGEPTVYANQAFNPPYTRALFLTKTLAVLFKFFGETLFVARLPSIFIDSLTIGILYILGKKINYSIGIISALLWAISPWAIASSQNVREYAFFPFVYLLTFIIIEQLSCRVLSFLEKQASFSKRQLMQFFLLLLPLLYGFFIDINSTFKQIIILYLAAIIFIIIRLMVSHRISKKSKNLLFLTTCIAGISFLLIFLQSELGFLSVQPTYDPYWPRLMLSNNIRLWSFNSDITSYLIILAIGTAIAGKKLFQKEYSSEGLILLTGLLFFYLFSFHFARYHKPRYGFSLLIWTIPILALGIESLINTFIAKEPRFKKIPKTMIILIFLLGIFNPVNTIQAIYQDGNNYISITDEYHDAFIPVKNKYYNDIKPDTVIICSLCTPFYWHDMVALDNNNLFSYNYRDKNRFKKIQNIIKSNSRGWIILDRRRNNHWSKGLPAADFRMDGTDINYLETLSGFYIYRWDKLDNT